MSIKILQRIAFFAIVAVLVISLCDTAGAQCAMCKANAENAQDDAAKGLNTAIMFLLMTPYILIAAIGYWWYSKNKKTGTEEEQSGLQ